MSFLTETLGGAGTKPKSFLDSVSVATPQSVKEANYAADAFNAQQVSDQANSPKILAEGVVKGATIDPLVTFAHSLWGTYQQTPSKLAEDIKAGATDFQQGNIIKGITKVAGRTAGDVAIAVFAPISSAIGAVLTASGGQQLTDEAGQVIANHNGITDLPAFQKFAMEHPNVGEDFNRLLTLFMAKGEKGQIDPLQVADDAKSLATKMVGSSKLIPPEPAVPTPTPPPETFQPAVKGGFLEQTSPAPQSSDITKTASDINQNLVKKGFEALPPEQQAKYTPQSYSEIESHASSLLQNDLANFKEMMTGRSPLSPEIQRNPEIYHNALEAYATDNPTPDNVQLLRDLANSPVSQTSRAAQILGGHGFNDNPNSAVRVMEDLNTDLKTKIEKRTRKTYSEVEKPVIDETRAAKDSVKVTPQTWSDFVDSIKCNY